MSTTRRELILGAVGAVAAQPLQALAAPRLQVRIWPGDESTRISVESDRKLKYSYMVLRGKKPYRLVLDLEGLRLNANIEKTLKNFNSSDKFIAGIRPGQFKPNILRIVFDLKDDVRADVNYSKPIAQFGHRIIIDLEATNADTMREVIARTGANEEPAKEVKREQSKPNTVSETQRVTKKKPPKKSGKTETLVVVIDAGHGGEDPGAIGKISKEKNINLNVALKVGNLIKRNCDDVKVIYTRSKDVFIPLDRRAEIANNAKADLFISIHTNALANNRTAKGASTWTLGLAKSEANLEVAKRENAVILYESDYETRYAGFNPNSAESYIIFEFMQDKYMEQSASGFTGAETIPTYLQTSGPGRAPSRIPCIKSKCHAQHSGGTRIYLHSRGRTLPELGSRCQYNGERNLPCFSELQERT